MVSRVVEIEIGWAAVAMGCKWLLDGELYDGPEEFGAWPWVVEEREFEESAELVRRLRMGEVSGASRLRR